MASILDADLTASHTTASRPLPRRALAMLVLLRRRWRRRLWAAQLRRELGDARLLDDVGAQVGSDAGEIVALARALGGGKV